MKFINPKYTFFAPVFEHYRIPMTKSSYLGYMCSIFCTSAHHRKDMYFLFINPYKFGSLDYMGWEFGFNYTYKTTSYRPYKISMNRLISGFSNKYPK